MAEIFGLVLPFFGVIFLGYGVARIRKLPLDALGWMNFFIIYVALPCLFFQLLSKTPIEKLTEWRFIAASMIATYAVFTLVFLIAYWRGKRELSVPTIQGLAAAYGNIGYMAPGIALLAFGQAAAVPLALIFCFENLMHFIVAPLFMALSGTDKRAPLLVAKDVAAKILLHPFIIATFVGVSAAALHWQPPQAITAMVDVLARAAAPCALFAMGVTLAMRPLKGVPVELGYIVPVKLIAHPLMCYFMMQIMGDFDPVWVATAVLLASLPTATNVFVLAQQYGVWVEKASAAILVTTMISVLTVTTWLYAIKSGLLAL
jgi:malonate transporter and related proteins